MIEEYKMLGQHLVVDRGSYTHHGICVSPTKVIHYSGGFEESSKKGPVLIDDIQDFAKSDDIYVRKYQNRENYSSKSMDRAFSKLGEDRYNLFLNNCEHFATWCRIGEAISLQVRNRIIGIASISVIMTSSFIIGDAADWLIRAMEFVPLEDKERIFEEIKEGIDYEDLEIDEYIKRVDFPSGNRMAFPIWDFLLERWCKKKYIR